MRTWSAFVTVFVVVIATVNLIATARRIPPPSRIDPSAPPDVVLKQEARLVAVRRALERVGARGVIGYVSDLPPDQLATDAAGMREYFLSQFALAPLVLDARFGDVRWVVVNLHRAPLTARMPSGFRVVEDGGAGVWLIERSRP